MESPALGYPLVGLLVVAVLLLANAYFVATEFALVAVRRTQVQLWVDQGRRGAAAAAHAVRNLDDAIAMAGNMAGLGPEPRTVLREVRRVTWWDVITSLARGVLSGEGAATSLSDILSEGGLRRGPRLLYQQQ